ncbi:MAG TPA: extracellular solute-binding protein [Methylomirabilota bacterium]|jgi:ABC-type glycerol-3-phosphate transport system substrate-binding protein|nr:extracellular solute-binding protein [Methylomirabilota bacterium]
MNGWQSDPRLVRLVAERREGALSRRTFLARLAGTGAGLAGATLVGGARPAGAQKRVVVTMWDTEPNPATRAAVKAIVEDFQKLHKDIEIRAEGMGWGDMDRKLQAAMAAKSPPTASHTQTYVVTSFRAKGLIEPVDDLVNAVGKDRIFPSVLQWLEYDGRFWGMTHAWGADNLGGRGDLAREAGVNPQGWKTWDDWLRDLPKLNKAPTYYALSMAGIPFFVNEDVYMWTGSNGGRLFDDQGNPQLDSRPVIEMLEFWKKVRGYMPSGWASHDYLETLSAWASGKAAQCFMWGRTAGYIDQYAPADKRNPDIFQMWPKTIGPSGTKPLTQFDNEPWVIYADASADEKAAAKEFLKFFFKKENYRRYCDSVPVHLLSIFKEDFQDASYLGHPERKRWKPWLDAQVRWVEQGRAHPLLVCDPKERLVPWLGDVAAAPILADMVMAVVERGRDPRVAAKEANEKIARDIIGKAKKA